MANKKKCRIPPLGPAYQLLSTEFYLIYRSRHDAQLAGIDGLN